MEASRQGVVLINPFEVPPDRDDEFISEWEAARDFLQQQSGYVDTALHRSLGPDAEFRFVDVVHWASPQEFQAAMAMPDFPGPQSSFRAHPSLYRVVVEDETPAEATVPVVLINAFELPAEADQEFLTAWERTREFMQSLPHSLGPSSIRACRRRPSSDSSTSRRGRAPRRSKPRSRTQDSGRPQRRSSTEPIPPSSRWCVGEGRPSLVAHSGRALPARSPRRGARGQRRTVSLGCRQFPRRSR